MDSFGFGFSIDAKTEIAIIYCRGSIHSGIGKLGVQYKLSDQLSLELNGMAVRSLTNIVDESQGTTGCIIPFLVGLDFRVGYQF